MPQIWQDPQEFQNQAGQIWAQGQHQQLAGQAWANEALQQVTQPLSDAFQKLQSMVPDIPGQAPQQAPAAAPAPAPAPAPPPPPTPEPTPAPAQVGPVPEQGSASQLPTAPLPTTQQPMPAAAPTPTPASAPTPTPAAAPVPSMSDTGQNWAQQQIASLLNPNSSSSSASTSPSTSPAAQTTASMPSQVPSQAGDPTGAVDSSSPQSFAQTFAPYAQYAAQKLGIDPKWVAAMAASESNYGKAAGNELFGVKALPGQPGTTMMTHEGENGGVNMNQTFAAYDSPKAAVDAWVSLLQNHYPGAPGAQNLGDFVQALHNGGYMTAGAGEYLNLVQGIEGKIGSTVDNALSGAQAALSGGGSPGSGAPVNTPSQGAQAVAARNGTPAAVEPQRQFETEAGLSTSDAYTACGPVAAAAFAQTYGRNPTPQEAISLARQVGWSPDQGMAGPGSEVQLLQKMGVDAHVTSGVNWTDVQKSATSGNPVILSTPNHYLYVDGYNADTGEYHVGASGSALRGGSEWMTPDQIASVPGTHGAAQAAIFVDHPVDGSGLTMGTNQGVGAGSQGKLGMGAGGGGGSGAGSAGLLPGIGQTGTGGNTGGAGSSGLLPAAVGGQASGSVSSVQNLIKQGQDLSQQLLNQQAQNIQGAVNNVGDLSSSLGTSTGTQSLQDILNQGAQLAQGISPLAGAQQATSSLPSYLQGLGTNASSGLSDIGQDILNSGLGRGVQAGAGVLNQEQQDLLNRPTELQDLQQNMNLLRQGDIGNYLAGSGRLASRIVDESTPLSLIGNMPIGITNMIEGALGGAQIPTYQQNPLEAGDISQPTSAALTAGGVDPNVARVLGQVPNLLAPMAFEHGIPLAASALERGLPELAAGGLGLVDLLRPPQAAYADVGDLSTMYHGTGADFATPDPTRFNAEGLYGPGYYLTSDPRVAGGLFREPDMTGSYLPDLQGGYAESQMPQAYHMMNEELENAAYYRDLAQNPRDQIGNANLTDEEAAAKAEDYAFQARQSERQAANLADRGFFESGPNVRQVGVPPVTGEPRQLTPTPPPEFYDTPEGQQMVQAGQGARDTLNRLLSQGGTYMTDESGQRVPTPEYAAAQDAVAQQSQQFQAARQAYIDNLPPPEMPAPTGQMHLLDMDTPVSDQALNNVRNVLENSADYRDQAVLDQVDRYTGSGMARGQDLYDALASVNKDFANRTLAAAGFDGIQHEGGQRIPMNDENGLPISHRVNVIFPESMDNLTNMVSHTQGGFANPMFALHLGGAGLGGYLGYQSAPPGASDQERWARAAAGAAAGFGAANLATTLATAPITRPATLPGFPGGPAPMSVGDWLRSAYRGGVISGLNTAADVAFNSTLSPVLSMGKSMLRDLASFQPGRIQGRVLGAQSGMTHWAANFLQGVSDVYSNPNSATVRSSPGLAELAARLTTGMGAIHGGFQNATAELEAAMEQGAAAGEVASKSASGAGWFTDFNTAFTHPTADVVARAQGLGARVAARSTLGTLASSLGSEIQRLGPVGDALFPVYRMGMNFAARRVENSPLGVLGTGFDVARGMAGQGPYADIARVGLRNAFDVVPTSDAVGPLGERLTNNLVGTAISLWLANQAVAGNVTGSGPTDAKQRAIMEANGWQPNSFRVPGTDQFVSYDRLPPDLQGPMLAAGAYADSVQAYNEAGARPGVAPSGTYNVTDPRVAQAWQLMTEVGKDLVSPTPLRTFADLYDTLTTGQGLQAAGSGLLGNVASNLLPLSGGLRSVAEMTDPYQRAVLDATQPGQIPQAVAERVQSQIPGLRESGFPGLFPGLPVRPDILGRPLGNPLQGLGEISPLRPAAGSPNPVLQALMNVGGTSGEAPDALSVGPYQIKLTPAEQRAWTKLHGDMVQQMSGQLVGSSSYAGTTPNIQKFELARLDAAASRVASAELLGQLGKQGAISTGPGGRLEAAQGGILAPAVGYGPDVSQNTQALQRQIEQMQSNALLQSGAAGRAGRQTLEQANASFQG